MTTYADLWLHIAEVPSGTDGLLFEVLSRWGFRPRAWSGHLTLTDLRGNFAAPGPRSQEELRILLGELCELDTCFALHQLPGESVGEWREGWRAVHVPGLPVAAGAADRHGRFLVSDEQVRALLDRIGHQPHLLAAELAALGHLDTVAAFERRWELVEP
jgi:hypothetical protein